MSISRLHNDTVSLLKKNGESEENIKANVTSEMIFITDSGILIESGDLLQRKMSNGGIETYEVIDPGFHEAFGRNIPAHYQIKHKNLGLPEAEKAIQQITYNISGNNARVNNHSVDNSTNVVQTEPAVIEHIQALRQEIKRVIESDVAQKDALEIVDAIEGQFESAKPSKAVISSLISALPHAGSIASIGSFLVSVLGG
ncbi:hypothetical protein [Photobacterium sanguinicancri]|uniref:AbiTii domain-containing protein n=1 Tax=Photobacterium sanguinicancri TaxID=875932 RepID=A0ABX4FW47_9GAMM|nr:hypothetical protein [Photobacterium sanguinicancri]OZS42040.1 hypothetical protein ASV53_20575 [Photobacterium sanguinicancri]